MAPNRDLHQFNPQGVTRPAPAVSTWPNHFLRQSSGNFNCFPYNIHRNPLNSCFPHQTNQQPLSHPNTTHTSPAQQLQWLRESTIILRPRPTDSFGFRESTSLAKACFCFRSQPSRFSAAPDSSSAFQLTWINYVLPQLYECGSGFVRFRKPGARDNQADVVGSSVGRSRVLFRRKRAPTAASGVNLNVTCNVILFALPAAAVGVFRGLLVLLNLIVAVLLAFPDK